MHGKLNMETKTALQDKYWKIANKCEKIDLNSLMVCSCTGSRKGQVTIYHTHIDMRVSE